MQDKLEKGSFFKQMGAFFIFKILCIVPVGSEILIQELRPHSALEKFDKYWMKPTFVFVDISQK